MNLLQTTTTRWRYAKRLITLTTSTRRRYTNELITDHNYKVALC